MDFPDCFTHARVMGFEFIPFDNKVVKGYLDRLEHFGFVGHAADHGCDHAGFIVVERDHRDAGFRIVVLEMIAFPSTVVMNDNDDFIPASGCHLEFFAYTWKIDFADIHYALPPKDMIHIPVGLITDKSNKPLPNCRRLTDLSLCGHVGCGQLKRHEQNFTQSKKYEGKKRGFAVWHAVRDVGIKTEVESEKKQFGKEQHLDGDGYGSSFSCLDAVRNIVREGAATRGREVVADHHGRHAEKHERDKQEEDERHAAKWLIRFVHPASSSLFLFLIIT
jgi:hypothetical protein